MSLRDDLKAYQNRWKEVNAFINQERQTASFELCWRQLNAAYAMAIELGLPLQDSTESEVFERWAKLK